MSELFNSDGEQMDVERKLVTTVERMFAVRENFHVAKGMAEQAPQARTGEEVLVIALEQMPRDDAPIMQVREQLHVRDGEERTSLNCPSDLGNERSRVLRVLDDFDADRAIKFGVSAGQLSRIGIHSAERQLPPGKDVATVRVRFQAEPLVPSRAQRRPISAGSAADVEN